METEIDRFADSYKAAIEQHRVALQREVSQVRNTKMSTNIKHNCITIVPHNYKTHNTSPQYLDVYKRQSIHWA